MRLLVCGGAGFIGNAFVRRRLSATSDEIVVLDKLTYAGGRDNLADLASDRTTSGRLSIVEGDVCDPGVVYPLVRMADAVVDLAAESHVDRSILEPSRAVRTNVLGVQMLLDGVREAQEDDGRRRRIVVVSTDEVYGPIDSGAHGEDAPLSPQSPYAATKGAADLLALAAHRTHGLDIVVTRGTNTYGPRQHPEKVIPLFITLALRDQPLPLYGDGRQRRDWLYVDDHADAIAVCLERGAGGGIYNLPAGQERANREVARAILEHLGKPWSLVRSVEDRPAHDRRYALQGGRIAALGWSARVGFDEGIATTVDWYRTHAAWWEGRLDAAWEDYYERQYAGRLASSVEVADA